MKLIPQNQLHQPITDDVGETVEHTFEPQAVQAINAALAINRPLLVWGEPGIGKSQLARAAAKALGRVFLPFVANAETEAQDLLYHFDAVARLAEAQIQSAEQNNRNALAMDRFIVPGPLWWAFDWGGAEELVNSVPVEEQAICQRKVPDVQEDCSPANGAVVLIDEIDKAGSDVPNGLLEALGASRFHPRGLSDAVACQATRPLIMITTNEERNLPDAFQRRCLSLHLNFPAGDKQEVFLVDRAKLNFPEFSSKTDAESEERTVLEAAASMLREDREHAQLNRMYPLPGQAEYFDLLRGVRRLSQETKQTPSDLIRQLRLYVYQKHPGFHRQVQ